MKNPKESGDTLPLLRRFFSYFRPHRKLFLLDMGCALLVSAIDLVYPLVTRSALYDLLPENRYRAFFLVMGAIFLAYFLRTGLQYVINYWGHTFGIQVEADIRRDLYTHIQTLGFDFFDQNRTGSLMSRLTSDLFELTELAHHGPEDLVISVATVLGSLVIMFTIQWRLALVIAILVPVFLAVVMRLRREMKTASMEVKNRTAVINSEIESGLSGIRTAKAFANEGMETEKFDASNENFKVSKRSFHKAMARFNSAMEFFLCMLSAAVIAVGGFLIMQDRIDYIDLITFSLYISAFTSPIRRLANFSELFASGFAGLRRFAEIMDTEPTVRDLPDAKELTAVKGSIRVEGVSFSYETTPEVLRDVSVLVQPGETVAVVGPSGGGKTTLCSLIPRFYDVDEGSISIDGLDIRQVTQKSLRENIGIVQQDVFLFAASVRENIRYGRPDATDAEVVEAAKKAEIYEDILAMPQGFDTYVGERGMLLSGGQKQRISIARIFLKNPPILILDEATSALDSVTEYKIQRAFDALSKGRTTLIIAHRLSTIREAKKILVISEGKVAETGSHEELLEKGGHYAELYRTQFERKGL